MTEYTVLSGLSAPLGVTLDHQHGQDGINVALYSEHASGVELCLFDADGNETRLPITERANHIWRGFVPNVQAGQLYGFRVHGETNPEQGHYFNPQKLLCDPYAKALVGHPSYGSDEERLWYHHADPRDNADKAVKSIVVANDDFDWEGDQRLRTPWPKTVIYEMSVKGMTARHPDVPEHERGTFAGLAHPSVIAYLKDLGITAVELLPVTHHLDEAHLQAHGLTNYWGYNVLGHFATDPRYATDGNSVTAINEFKAAVKALHAAGIEVIMDVVYNHTAEQGIDDPMFCQKGIDNANYYWLTPEGYYENWSGCGNTVNAAKVHTTRWITDSLRYWAEECHVDGFRFDLGSVLGRTPAFSQEAAFFQAIYQDPILSECKMIAEPWDIGLGGYQLGAFPGRFGEWNDRYRNDMRQFWLHESGNLGALSTRIAGSSDIFNHNDRPAHASINFITAHDGFCLQDLVSYNEKHNEANGEDNRDGHNENISFNHGVEGFSDDPAINDAREASARALLAALCLSNGTPMLLAGDEIGHTQQGNNNTYCQDSELTWLNWNEANLERSQYVRELLAVRREIAAFSGHDDWWHAENAEWLNCNGEAMKDEDWQSADTKALQLLLDQQWLLLINGKKAPQTFQLPEGNWQPKLEYGCAVYNDSTYSTDGIGITVLKK
ncbi:glycogen debranching protein GlgX [Cardiobacteriaceae bacterium TAE3-ERU3]|nr:glycogen debranching protein GlgX [Cardiobacteriaceae bacterium TAE3-ERU3]